MSRSTDPSPLRRWLAAWSAREDPRDAPPADTAAPGAGAAADVEALRRALVRAEGASQAKSQFIAQIGHEVRTPMNGVVGMARLLAATTLDSTQRGYLDLLQRSAGGLIALLDQLLDFARLDSGDIGLQPQPVALRRLLDEVVGAAYPQALERRLLLECRLAADLPETVLADPGRLRQIVQSLLGNALKFTDVGEIVVAAHPSAEGIAIEVADTGAGVPPEFQERVFLPFVQGAVAGRHGGIGLGLAMADLLVRAFGGRIELASEPGRGARFTVHLPLARAEPPSRRPSGMPLRVGLVSDAPSAQRALAERLQWLGHECVATMTWRELAFAPEAMAAARPAAVVFDEPLEGWPPAAASPPPSPWATVLLQRRPDSRSFAPGLRVLHRPLDDAALAAVLQPAAPGMPASTPAPLPAPRRGRVLLVEDNEISQVVARSFLEHLGFVVDVAADAVQAFDALAAQDPVLVVMDCQMPGIDGYELTRRIRAGEAGPKAQGAPIIALTAHASAADRERCRAAGMNDYLAKPVDPALLGATIDRWLPPVR